MVPWFKTHAAGNSCQYSVKDIRDTRTKKKHSVTRKGKKWLIDGLFSRKKVKRDVVRLASLTNPSQEWKTC